MERKTEEVCSRLAPELRKQAKELCKIEKAMRDKIDKILPEFKDMPVAQEATTTQGERVLKANPAIQETRALFRDYAAVVKSQRDLFDNVPQPAEISSLDSLRKKYKLA